MDSDEICLARTKNGYWLSAEVSQTLTIWKMKLPTQNIIYGLKKYILRKLRFFGQIKIVFGLLLFFKIILRKVKFKFKFNMSVKTFHWTIELFSFVPSLLES